MKINMIMPGVNHSGGVQMAWQYLNYFTTNGADVICYSPMKSLVKTGLNSDSLGRWFPRNFKLKFIPVVNDFTIRNADITIATSWITSYWVSSLSSKKGKKVYFIQDYETWFSNDKNARVRESYHLPMDLRISVSTMLQQKLQKIDDCDSLVICNGIPKSFIKEKSIIQKSQNNSIVVGMPYREKKGNVDIKNCNFGMRVVKKLQKKNPNLKFQMYGFKRPKNLDKNIFFLENPSRNELIKWYDSVDILYIPSLYEGWGLPAMEGMARGCAVISSDTGCIKEFGKNKVNCIKLKNMVDEVQATNELQTLIDQNDTRNRIGTAALMTVKDYTFEKFANLFLSELDRLNREY